ncbi:hypothetical protein BKA93DRAFT_750176 [Sparassis latifolia]
MTAQLEKWGSLLVSARLLTRATDKRIDQQENSALFQLPLKVRVRIYERLLETNANAVTALIPKKNRRLHGTDRFPDYFGLAAACRRSRIEFPYICSPFMQGPRHHEFLVWYGQRGPGKVRMCLELFYDQSDKSLDPNRKGSVKSFTRYLCGYNV